MLGKACISDDFNLEMHRLRRRLFGPHCHPARGGEVKCESGWVQN
jgi:hypothetical protein